METTSYLEDPPHFLKHLFLSCVYSLIIFPGSFLLSVWPNVGLSGRRDLQLNNFPHQIGPWPFLWETVLTDHWCERTQPTAGSPIPEQVGLGCVSSGKKPEQEPAGSLPPWCLLQVPTLNVCPFLLNKQIRLWPGSVSHIHSNPNPLHVAGVRVFWHNIRNQTKTYI